MFDKLSFFIQDYIYSQGWKELRPIQIGACDVIFNSNKNIIISSGTASGKTEAAFFPVLTDIYENSKYNSIDVLYISPLKALINDQYDRLTEILKETDIPVFKWHGDVSASLKQKLIKTPKGIIQITPESLESLLMRKTEITQKMFSDLKYIIIDEIHYFLSEERGIQLRCLLERLQLLINKIPRRIALSATLGDYEKVSEWLNSGTNTETEIITDNTNKKIKLAVDYFPYSPLDTNKIEYYKKLYDRTRYNRNIIFSNSRTEVEENVYRLNKLAKLHHKETEYLGHHSSISASDKTDIESKMKSSENNISICSTTTLELGIDIGKLDQIVQTGTTYTVSSFLQRLGRAGRRDNIPQMLFSIKESEFSDYWSNNFNIELLLSVSIIELYRKYKWIETPTAPKKPFEILLHQTLSILYSMQPLSITELANIILNLSSFKDVTKQEYKILLKHLKDLDLIMFDEDKKLLLGEQGEKLVNNYNFLSVFNTIPEYEVRTAEKLIGTVSEKHKKDTVFLLQGLRWKVIELDAQHNTIYVIPATTEAKNKWTSVGNLEISDKIIKNIKCILESNEKYPYLTNSAAKKLEEMRLFYCSIRNNNNLFFPWVGTKKINSLHLIFDTLNINYEIIEIGKIKLGFKFLQKIDINEVLLKYKTLKEKNIIPELLDFQSKFQELLPQELLEIKYWSDYFKI